VVAPVLAAPWTAVAVVRWVEAVEVSLRRRTQTSRSKREHLGSLMLHPC
jgi:hypothetical protein